MLPDREKFISIAEKALITLGVSFKDLRPLKEGKKGLVYCFESKDGQKVLRLYRNPYKLSKVVLVNRILKKKHIDILAEIHRIKFIPTLVFSGVVGASVEEYLSPCTDVTLDDKRRFLAKLRALHSATKVKQPLLAKYLWNRWISKSKGSVDYVVSRRPDLEKPLRNLISQILESSVPEILALCHNDVANSNMGCKNGEIKLFDWDRATLFFPEFEEAQACYMLGLDREFSEYLNTPPGKLFLIARVKKLLKRGKDPSPLFNEF